MDKHICSMSCNLQSLSMYVVGSIFSIWQERRLKVIEVKCYHQAATRKTLVGNYNRTAFLKPLTTEARPWQRHCVRPSFHGGSGEGLATPSFPPTVMVSDPSWWVSAMWQQGQSPGHQPLDIGRLGIWPELKMVTFKEFYPWDSKLKGQTYPQPSE